MIIKYKGVEFDVQGIYHEGKKGILTADPYYSVEDEQSWFEVTKIEHAGDDFTTILEDYLEDFDNAALEEYLSL